MTTRARTRSARLDAFFDPEALAIVGASPNSGYFRVLQANLSEYTGKISLVNPRRSSIATTAVHPSVLDVPGQVDHALVITPGGAVPGIVEECRRAGVRAVTVYAGDTEPFDAWPISRETREAIERGDLMLSGPNCLGAVSTASRMVSYALPMRPDVLAGGVSTISHSGGSLGAWMKALHTRGIGTMRGVSTGNEIGLSTADYLEYLVQDPGTRIIVLQYLESLGDAPRFARAAEEALRCGKPVLAVRSGRSELGREGVQSHTGRLAPSSRDFEAIANSVGILEFQTMDDLLEGVAAFANERIPKGPRLAVHTVSGALCNHVADLVAEAGSSLSLSEFTDETRQRLEKALGGWSRVANPLDSSWPGQSDGDVYYEICEVLLADGNTDMLMIEGELPRADGSVPYRYDPARLHQLADAADKPVFVFSRLAYSPELQEAHRPELERLSFLQGAGRALTAVNNCVRWASRHANAAAAQPLDAMTGADALHRMVDVPMPPGGRSVVLHHELARFVAAYGIDVVAEAILAPNTKALPPSLRFPVAVKRADILHKSDLSAVSVDVGSDDELVIELERLARIETGHGGTPILLVQEMVDAPWEMFLGGHASDAGPIVVVGLGGIWSEYLQDTAVRLAPVPPSEAIEMLRELRAYPALVNDRAGRHADIEWLAQAVADFSRALGAAVSAGYEALELNPVMVGERGAGGVAVDIRGELRELPDSRD